MLIVVPAGYSLTADNKLIKGGPCCIGLGAGMRMDATGKIYYDGVKWEGEVFPQFEIPKEGMNVHSD